MSLRIDHSVRGVKCHECGKKIEKGQSYLVYNSNSWYGKNVCLSCLKSFVNKIERKNTYAKFITTCSG